MTKALTTGATPLNTFTTHKNSCTIMFILFFLFIFFRFKLLETKLESTLKSTLEIKEEKIAALEARLQESSNLNQQLRQELKTVSSTHACANTQPQQPPLENGLCKSLFPAITRSTENVEEFLRPIRYLFMSTFASKASLSIHVAAVEDVCVSSERCLVFDLADMNLKHDESGSCLIMFRVIFLFSGFV